MRQSERVDSIDHLRGILAATIMVYHYVAWSFPNWMSPDSLLSVLGYYGVAAFFSISGISLAIAYSNRLSNSSEIMRFLSRRFFRIAPLYWLVVSATVFFAVMAETYRGTPLDFTWWDVIANYTLTFSFGQSPALATGGWSIGNEIFFYLCFPLIFWLICKSAKWALALITVSVVLLALWAFVVVPSVSDGLEKWDHYISNWNQLFFFVAGVAVGRYVKPSSLSRGRSYVALAGALLVLSLASVSARSDLVEGWHRIFLSAAVLLLVASVYQINWQSSSFIGKVLAFMGLISYSLYLLHPLARHAVVIVGDRVGFDAITTLVLSMAVTILASWVSYLMIERSGIRVGKAFERTFSRRSTALT